MAKAKTISPSRVLDALKLWKHPLINVLTCDGSRLDRRVVTEDAVALAEHGLVIGIVTGAGILQAIRWAPPNTRDPNLRRDAATVPLDTINGDSYLGTSKSDARFSGSRMGVYLQALHEPVIALDRRITPEVIGETRNVIGHVYAHCGSTS